MYNLCPPVPSVAIENFSVAIPKRGVCSFAGSALVGKTDKIEDIIITNDKYKNLDIIFAGPVPPNPAELLLSERFDRMVTELKKHYDYVILDNVPVDIVADASIINRVVDLTIYVVRAGVMDHRQLPNLERMYVIWPSYLTESIMTVKAMVMDMGTVMDTAMDMEMMKDEKVKTKV